MTSFVQDSCQRWAKVQLRATNRALSSSYGPVRPRCQWVGKKKWGWESPSVYWQALCSFLVALYIDLPTAESFNLLQHKAPTRQVQVYHLWCLTINHSALLPIRPFSQGVGLHTVSSFRWWNHNVMNKGPRRGNWSASKGPGNWHVKNYVWLVSQTGQLKVAETFESGVKTQTKTEITVPKYAQKHNCHKSSMIRSHVCCRLALWCFL